MQRRLLQRRRQRQKQLQRQRHQQQQRQRQNGEEHETKELGIEDGNISNVYNHRTYSLKNQQRTNSKFLLQSMRIEMK